MADSEAKTSWYEWYQSFDQTHSPEARQQWYSDSTQAYRWARPSYPDSLVDQVIQKAGLSPDSSVLEIGCGPGIATASFAARGLAMQSVEPSAAACELARQACQAYPQVAIANSTFESFDLENQQFDAVLAATSFHWVSPEVACQKSAAALKPGGSLILLWATPPQPDEELRRYLQPVYEQYQLAERIRYQWQGQDYYHTNFDHFAQIVGKSGWFERTEVAIEQHQSSYSVEKYLALLTTLSDYIALDEQTRSRLLADLSTRLKERQIDDLSLMHWFGWQVAPLKGTP
ncbi:Cyclopropane-fatty-acyl-phospholipid synthase superfamily [Synechococcus sp. PCC 7335]|uniref:class I SAM-dependent methyltransferase n=1 Tax=Synechococcus sp. (strain ATCC 29403 / PCC 7335) TaxID=91464 RepID=UPI00017EE37A|nr:class I SAM-dependent methyltransferase [Synechococcus sp. PCC 7335]EDX85087.1 Cyclopropane-fatty-acyl-phospholipid synthase superfamily [Synechococcus sp. PCC 7335]